MQVEQLRHAEQGLGLFEDHMAFVRSLAFDLNVDETTLILLLVIALFSPDRERLNDRELIAAQQERYVAPPGELLLYCSQCGHLSVSPGKLSDSCFALIERQEMCYVLRESDPTVPFAYNRRHRLLTCILVY